MFKKSGKKILKTKTIMDKQKNYHQDEGFKSSHTHKYITYFWKSTLNVNTQVSKMQVKKYGKRHAI